MRNRITCSAQTLIQLEPEMIRSVVGGQVYGLGAQYFTESRVNILETDMGQVSAEVSGTFGVYTQTIKLRGGVLSTKCSCPSNEKPFCRHCVAVLLQHYQDTGVEQPSTGDSVSPDPMLKNGKVNGSVTSNDFNFRDVTIFVDWMQSSVPGLGRPGALPDLPDLPMGAVKGWGQSIENLHEEFLKSEEIRIETQESLRVAQEQIVTFTQDLEVSRRETKDSQGACVGLQNEIKKYQESLADFDRVREDRDRIAKQIQQTREDLQKKSAELERLVNALKSLSTNLQ